MPDLSLETAINGSVCGIDEAGRGPWAGPVVASAVILGEDIPEGINDSKKLSEKKREMLYEQILKNCEIGVGIAEVAEIDELNIGKATKLAMRRAFENLPRKPDFALVDGNQLPDLPCKMQYVIKGDSVSLSIAAASIIAKVTRDRMICKLAQEFPHYGWEKNKGYGTKDHQLGLAENGICEHHRKSYAPIKKFL
ncbi:MAG: ribonuclease HII [Alphaproteobacteria bacterium CG11_big_fil_rev_8_21_14_0_20_44_7]|nr:MAG: ribonuclease HII [Alphaproteobacteria bacterium CG11_big_fil_rev_8_21_14_0_20_44_7]